MKSKKEMKFIKLSKPIFEINRFFTIPDGEIDDYTLIDENGNDYDLKLTYSARKVFNEILCDNDGYFTNKEGLKLFENHVSFPQTRKAVTKEDFEWIFNKEFEKSGTHAQLEFLEILKEDVKIWRDRLPEKLNKDTRNIRVLSLQFINWLENLKNQSNELESYPDVKQISPNLTSDPFKGKTNIFNEQPLNEVREHFERLCRPASNGKPIFTPTQLDNFIKRAFCGDTSIDKITVSITNNRPTIGRVLQAYYDSIKDKGEFFSSPKKNHKSSYLELISENINDFTFQQVKDNCRK